VKNLFQINSRVFIFCGTRQDVCLNDRPEMANHSVGPFLLDAQQAPLYGVQPVLVFTLGCAGRPALAKANAPAQEKSDSGVIPVQSQLL